MYPFERIRTTTGQKSRSVQVAAEPTLFIPFPSKTLPNGAKITITNRER
jgi:hypothetical protein